MNSDAPQLSINYSPEFDLQFRSAMVDASAAAGDYALAAQCVLRHPTGNFKYDVQHLYFADSDLTNFAEGLRCMHQGTADEATLRNQGGMFAFLLERKGRTLRASLNVREYVPHNGSANLSFTTEVDYDLFVNKLAGAMEQFVRELREAS